MTHDVSSSDPVPGSDLPTEDRLPPTDAAARFEAERQAMARLSHPNIARILEAGTTSDGFPYFAMEFVEGAAITRYCNEQRLPLDERLRLFLTVCRGVQAHRLRGADPAEPAAGEPGRGSGGGGGQRPRADA